MTISNGIIPTTFNLSFDLVNPPPAFETTNKSLNKKICLGFFFPSATCVSSSSLNNLRVGVMNVTFFNFQKKKIV
mgnify:CR=1 FL=1